MSNSSGLGVWWTAVLETNGVTDAYNRNHYPADSSTAYIGCTPVTGARSFVADRQSTHSLFSLLVSYIFLILLICWRLMIPLVFLLLVQGHKVEGGKGPRPEGGQRRAPDGNSCSSLSRSSGSSPAKVLLLLRGTVGSK